MAKNNGKFGKIADNQEANANEKRGLLESGEFGDLGKYGEFLKIAGDVETNANESHEGTLGKRRIWRKWHFGKTAGNLGANVNEKARGAPWQKL